MRPDDLERVSDQEVIKLSAAVFRDFTRIAASDPVMWRDIAIANKVALLESIDLFSEHLAELRKAVEREDGEHMHAIFSRAKEARDGFAAILAQRQQDKKS